MDGKFGKWALIAVVALVAVAIAYRVEFLRKLVTGSAA